MGVILCEQHGKTGIALICPHLYQDYFSNQPLHDFVRVKFYVFDEGEADAQIYPLCKECLDHYSLGLGANIKLKWEDWFERLKLEPVCGKCFRDYEDSFGKRGWINAEPDYKNTPNGLLEVKR